MSNATDIYNTLLEMFPNAHCELNYTSLYELTVAVMLSAQTTDKAVNLVTPTLFKKYPDIYSLSKANISDIEIIIKRLGLYRNKAINLKNMAIMVEEKYQGLIPNNLDELKSLPGIGQKTANVILVEYFKIPRMPVDTHIERVSKRLGLVDEKATTLEVEKKLMELFIPSTYHMTHHLLLFFGRYHCTSRNPKCTECKLIKYCQKNDKKTLD